MAEDKKDIILSIRGMSKSFGRNKVLKHIDLDVKRGSIMGLMGENGAGKSTMMKCLFGTYQKTRHNNSGWKRNKLHRTKGCFGKRCGNGSSGIEPVPGKKCD